MVAFSLPDRCRVERRRGRSILLCAVQLVCRGLSDSNVRRWYYYRGSYCKATEVEERTDRRLVLRRIATLGSHLVQTIDIHAAKSLLA
jgi:hypothetical protein